jgi:drug/metabolite transporter (DMT)-like permease
MKPNTTVILDPQPKTISTTLAWIILIGLAMIWGSSFILVKRGLEAFSPLQVAAIRTTVGFLVLSIYAVWVIQKVPRQKLVFLFLSGMMGVFIPAFLFSFAQTKLSSSLAGILNALTPLFTLLIGIVFYQQKGNSAKYWGVFLGLIGSVGLSLVSAKSGSLGFNSYIFLVVIATILYGTNVNLVKHYLNDIKPIYVSTLSLFCIGPLALLTFWQTDVITTLQTQKGSGQSFMYLVLLGTFSTAIATIFFNYLLQVSSAVFASSVTYLIPIVAIIWGFLDKESLHWSHLLCFGFILLGVWLVNKPSKNLIEK